jgi:hypothetical protein
MENKLTRGKESAIRSAYVSWQKQRATPSRQTRFYFRFLGAAASIGFHCLLFAPLLLGNGGSRHHVPDRSGTDSGGQSEETEYVLTATFAIEDPDDPAESVIQGSQRVLQPSQLPRLTLNLEPEMLMASVPIEANDEDKPREAEAQGDQVGQALMFGRYLGQITARISRAWARPRTPIGDESFSCRVQIQQDRSGTVKEIMLRQCNGDTRWQLSLVRAIQSASPLPAPPDPAVFTSSLTLRMESDPFLPGHGTDGFEPPSTSELVHDATQTQFEERQH